jgi:uncharacterized protein
MDKKFAIQIFFLILVICGALYFSRSDATIPLIPSIPGQVPSSNLSPITINGVTINAEIADTQDKRNKGLSGRESLATDSGMLFTYQDSGKYTFWMKGMKFPLDMIWINGKTVVDIIKNATPPLPGQKDETLSIYTSNQNADKMLEVNAGFVDAHGIKVGDTVEVK